MCNWGQNWPSSRVWRPPPCGSEPGLCRSVACLQAGLIRHCYRWPAAHTAVKELGDNARLASDNPGAHALDWVISHRSTILPYTAKKTESLRLPVWHLGRLTWTKAWLCSGQEENKSPRCSSSVYKALVKEAPLHELNSVQRTGGNAIICFQNAFKKNFFCSNNFITNAPENQYILTVKIKREL